MTARSSSSASPSSTSSSPSDGEPAPRRRRRLLPQRRGRAGPARRPHHAGHPRRRRRATASWWSRTCARATSHLGEGSVVPGGTTSTATAHLDAEHAATYDFDLVWDLPALELPEDVAGVHVGSLGTVLEPGRVRGGRPRAAGGRGRRVRQLRPEHPAVLPRRPRPPPGVTCVALGAGARLVKLTDEDLRLLRHRQRRGGRLPRAAGRRAHRAGGADPRCPGRGGLHRRRDAGGARAAHRRGRHRRCRRLLHGGDAGACSTTGTCWAPAPCGALDDARVELLVQGAVSAAAIDLFATRR